VLVRAQTTEGSPWRRPEFSPARKAHPAFLVPYLAGLVRQFEQAGYTCAVDEPLEGYNRVYVDDAFGNRIELMEYVPTDEALR